MRKRLLAVAVAAVIVFGGIGARYLQIANSGFAEVSKDQSTRVQTAAVARGTIYDRYFQPLVNSTSRVTASVGASADVKQVIADAVKEDEREMLLEQLAAGERVVTTLDGWLPPTVGMIQFEAPVRYSDDPQAVHLIGYISGDGDGVTGIEKGYDEILSSFVGKATVSYQTDALGRASTDGRDTLTNTLSNAVGGVVLTLDAQIQRIVQNLSAAYLERGAVIVSDAANGEVLAAVSLPTYDPNDVASALNEKSSPLIDRTLLNYNCGSVFKIITAAAALENGFGVDTVYTCTGSYRIGENVFHCHNRLGDGQQTMDTAMANSCNSYFIQLAMAVGAEAIVETATAAGFAQDLLICDGYRASCGVLPSKADLSADAALANLAIGQGDLLATPYHIHTLFGAIAAGGIKRQPTVYLGSTDDGKTLASQKETVDSVRLFSYRTARQLESMLEGVVENGTGKAASPSYLNAAGKTGTAQTGWEQDGKEVVQSWFAGYYPVSSPQYVITVLSENGGANGKTAAPLFKEICDALFEAGLL